MTQQHQLHLTQHEELSILQKFKQIISVSFSELTHALLAKMQKTQMDSKAECEHVKTTNHQRRGKCCS